MPRPHMYLRSGVAHIFTTSLQRVLNPVEGEPPVKWAVEFDRDGDEQHECGGRIVLTPPRHALEAESIVCASCGTDFAPTEFEAVVTAYADMRKAERNATDRARAAELHRQNRAGEVRQSMAELEQHTSQKVMAHLISKHITTPKEKIGAQVVRLRPYSR